MYMIDIRCMGFGCRALNIGRFVATCGHVWPLVDRVDIPLIDSVSKTPFYCTLYRILSQRIMSTRPIARPLVDSAETVGAQGIARFVATGPLK